MIIKIGDVVGLSDPNLRRMTITEIHLTRNGKFHPELICIINARDEKGSVRAPCDHFHTLNDVKYEQEP